MDQINTDFFSLLPNIVGGADDQLNSSQAQQLFAKCSVQSYLIEHQRMLKINAVCGHNKFNSKDAFCNIVIKRMRIFMYYPNDNTAYDLCMLHDLISEGWCASCNIRITRNLPIVKMHLINRISEYVIITSLCNLYSNSLQYFQIAKHYLFQKNNKHHALFIFELFACLLNCKIMKKK
eukprot:98954_1